MAIKPLRPSVLTRTYASQRAESIFPDSQGDPQMRLTDATVAALTVPHGRSEIIVFDSSLPGFGVRARRGGSKRFIFQYKLNGTNRRVTFKEANVKRARAAAQILAAKVTLGSDPALEKETAHDAAGRSEERRVGKEWREARVQ